MSTVQMSSGWRVGRCVDFKLSLPFVPGAAPGFGGEHCKCQLGKAAKSGAVAQSRQPTSLAHSDH